MKSRLNPNTWRQKRGRLPVKGSPDAGWARMQSMLDARMPAANNIAKPYRLPGSNWWLKWVLGAASMVVIGAGVSFYFAGNDSDLPKTGVENTRVAPKLPTPPAIVKTQTDSPKNNSVIFNPAANKSGSRQVIEIKPDSIPAGRNRRWDTISLANPLNRLLSDSVTTVPTISLPKPVHDSTINESLPAKAAPKDTAKNGNKPGKKKRRRISIFS